jgi:predicted ATPase/class 3 adenylate cyclase
MLDQPLPESGGTVTFLFTDIEGSTRLWEERPAQMREALDRHDAILSRTIARHGGRLFKTMGDAFFAAFPAAPEALAAALEAQRALGEATEPGSRGAGEPGGKGAREPGGKGAREPGSEVAREPGGKGAGEHPRLPLRVRMALHTGAAQERGGDYFGPTLSRVARLLDAGHGGQILVSLAACNQIRQDVPPGVELRDLGTYRLKDLQRAEPVFQVAHPDLRASFPPLRSLETERHNLPVQLSSFIGREREIADVKRLLGATRLITLTGPGGCGKTRLALQVAADLLDEYPGGAWFVELATLSNPALVLEAVAAALGVTEAGAAAGPRRLREALIDRGRDQKILLLLDNCEHLIDACARVAEDLLRAMPQMRALATSREALGIGGETVWNLPPLSLPDEAVPLFAERARAALPGFAVTERNVAAVSAICRQLDGLPLAIELAAARVKAVPVEQIAARLASTLGARFQLLGSGGRTAEPRQQTLRAAIDWSYDLLSEPERALLPRLAVFAGGWSLEAAESVCADETIQVLGLLFQLVEKSLVVYEEAAAEGQARYRFLETVRQYAQEKLDESAHGELVRATHCGYFLGLAEAAEPELQGPRQAGWLRRLEVEHDNLRAALEWSVATEGGSDVALRLTLALWRFWYVRGHLSEGRQWLERALGSGSRADDDLGARALNGAGVLAWAQGDYQAAQRFHEQSLAIRSRLGDRPGIATSLNNLGLLARSQEDYVSARSYFEQGLAIYRELRDRARTAMVLTNLGVVMQDRADFDAARPLFEESLAIQREIGDESSIASALHNLGELLQRQGDSAAAHRLLAESLAIEQELGDRRGIALSLTSLAILAKERGEYGRAAHLYAAALAALEAVGAPLSPSDRAIHESHIAAIRAALGDAGFEVAWDQGAAMTLGQAAEVAVRVERW